jgi:hypothetical protein
LELVQELVSWALQIVQIREGSTSAIESGVVRATVSASMSHIDMAASHGVACDAAASEFKLVGVHVGLSRASRFQFEERIEDV